MIIMMMIIIIITITTTIYTPVITEKCTLYIAKKESKIANSCQFASYKNDANVRVELRTRTPR